MILRFCNCTGIVWVKYRTVQRYKTVIFENILLRNLVRRFRWNSDKKRKVDFHLLFYEIQYRQNILKIDA